MCAALYLPVIVEFQFLAKWEEWRGRKAGPLTIGKLAPAAADRIINVAPPCLHRHNYMEKADTRRSTKLDPSLHRFLVLLRTSFFVRLRADLTRIAALKEETDRR